MTHNTVFKADNGASPLRFKTMLDRHAIGVLVVQEKKKEIL